MARRSNGSVRTGWKILTRATEAFASNGFEGGRVGPIAQRSGLSKNMLYYYFHSEEKYFSRRSRAHVRDAPPSAA